MLFPLGLLGHASGGLYPPPPPPPRPPPRPLLIFFHSFTRLFTCSTNISRGSILCEVLCYVLKTQHCLRDPPTLDLKHLWSNGKDSTLSAEVTIPGREGLKNQTKRKDGKRSRSQSSLKLGFMSNSPLTLLQCTGQCIARNRCLVIVEFILKESMRSHII